MQLELEAPLGKTRVICCSQRGAPDFLVSDFDSPEEAFQAIEIHATGNTGRFDDYYQAFNHDGCLIGKTVRQ